MFGHSLTVMGGDHNVKQVGVPMRFVKSGGTNIPILIEDDVRIGSNAIILNVAKLGEGCVIVSGSVVKKSLLPYSVCVGKPCKSIKLRFTGKNLGSTLNKLVRPINQLRLLNSIMNSTNRLCAV
jgi:acetyltransferase-like isoleucine patch superfamily enzyme